MPPQDPPPPPPPPPTASDVSTSDGSSVQDTLDALRDQLQPLSELRVTDPDHAGIETDNTPAPGQPTHDPHRITLVVPTPDETVFSLGQGAPTRIKDTGITGRTKTHIHFHAKEEPQTMLLLGHGTQEGWAGYKGNLLSGATGHMMVTEGASWTESKEQMYVVSRDDDVVVRAPHAGKKVLVQADDGSVWVGGGKGVIIGGKKEVSIYADTGFEKSEADYKGEITEAIEKKFSKGWTQWATTAFDWGQTIVGLIQGVIGLAHERKEAKLANKGWKVKSLPEFGAMSAELGKLIYAMAKTFQGEESPGSVSIHAEHEVGVAAGGVLELFGQTGAGISSPITVDLIGGTVGAKAATYGGVWAGINASLTGGKEANVSAGLEVKIKSKEVAITGSESVAIGAGEAAVMSAEAGHAVIFGKEWVYAGAEGYGMKATEHKLALGKMSSPADYAAAAADNAASIQMDNDSVQVIKGSGHLSLTKSGDAEIKGKKVFLISDDSAIDLANGKILIGH